MVRARVIDKKQLQIVQDLICSFVGVSGIILDNNLKPLSDVSNDKICGGAISQLLGSEYLERMLEMVSDGSPEDICIQSIEDSESGMISVAAVSIRPDSHPYITGVVAAPAGFGEARFVGFLDMMKKTVERYLAPASSEDANADLYDGKETDTTVLVLETTKNILELMDSSDGIEAVFKKWIELTAGFLKTDYAEILRLSGNGPDIVARFVLPEVSATEAPVKMPPGIVSRSNNPLIVSSDLLDKDPDFYDARRMGIKAFMNFPLLVRESGEGTFIACFYQKKHRRSWTIEEIRFASDAVRIMQSIIHSRLMYSTITKYSGSVTDILDNVGCCVFLTSETTNEVLFANNMHIETFGSSWQDGDLRRVISEGNFDDPSSGSFEFFYPQGRRWFDLMYKKVEWVDNSPAMLYSLYDITDRRLYQRKIEQQAFTDFLTGLYNRMCCEKDLAKLIDEAKMTSKKGAAVFIDLDDFKHINDGLGHQYGDILLKEISGALQKIRGVEGSCYRMGGDEFVVLVSPDAFERFDEIKGDILKVFASPWMLSDIEYYCTASIGTVIYPDFGDNVRDLLKKADIAMYSSKKTGKNRITEYSDGQETISGRRLDMEKNMRDASTSNYREFEVYYQPIMDIEGGEARCIGAEALVRWNSTKMGFISPSDFIPLAEYLGLINPIGDHVLEMACNNVREWNEVYGKDFKVNVNLSVVQLLQNDIVEIVEAMIKKTGIDPKRLCLEVTESLAINDMSRMIDILTGIKALGCTIALDDFGTGYSSLNHIREIPFDIIKVDQSFVRDLDTDSYACSFVKMVAELANTINVKVCLEGIETKSQMDKLDGMNIKYIQGYYFDRPLKKEEFEDKYIKN